MNKVYKFNYNYLKLLIDNKDNLLDNDLVILVTYIEVLQDKIEAYENMRKEAIELIENVDVSITEYLHGFGYENRKKDLLNILNKVGGSDETI